MHPIEIQIPTELSDALNLILKSKKMSNAFNPISNIHEIKPPNAIKSIPNIHEIVFTIHLILNIHEIVQCNQF